MQQGDEHDVVASALQKIAERSPQSTDGKWLEKLTVQVGPIIKEWDIDRCYRWRKWPEREEHFPNTTKQDVGIDAVAIRRSDGGYIAIQCKSRQLDELGHGDPISKGELDKFIASSAGDFWAERWVVTIGDTPIGPTALQTPSLHDKPIKHVNIGADLSQQQSAASTEECEHCQPNPDGEARKQSKSCMQDEAVTASILRLREHEQSASGGTPVGEARGKIILPCGTGKTRISLRIVEALTPPGALSIVLCPSIALVAQIRREYLQHANAELRILAVCSDETAGYNPRKEGTRNTAVDPTVDNSNVSAAEVKGKVTTDSGEIAAWINQGQDGATLNIIVGTYQSSYKVADALQAAGVRARVLVADEAHRTAGLRRTRKPEANERVRDFTLCHDRDAFPATYRVYQTATPRIYDTRKLTRDKPSDWIVRSMDDETVFGVELYRKSYVEAVHNGWLADYRIIALGVNDEEAFKQANTLALNTESKGRQALTSAHYLRGLALALAMGGATQGRAGRDVLIKSCIAFMNTVDKSRNMAKDLQNDAAKEWVQHWLTENADGQAMADYSLEHLDATSNVAARDNAKLKLAKSSGAKPHGIINVGIFGEGTDSPSLSAVAFLEPRKSPIDVIQAVGRAMRTAPGKDMGYIICPILLPPNVDPESWLSVSGPDEGWQELGQILLALRAHDQRIEDQLEELLHLYIPSPPPEGERTIVAIADGERKRIRYAEHEGAPGEAQKALERVLNGQRKPFDEFQRLGTAQEAVEPVPVSQRKPPGESRGIAEAGGGFAVKSEPTQIITGKKNSDGSHELRQDTVEREKPKPDGTRGAVDYKKSKAKAKKMINDGEGVRLPPSSRRRAPRRSREEVARQSAMRMLRLSGMEEHGNAIKLNLLTKSGLSDDRVIRDLNILEGSIKEASLKQQADGCTIAALLMMNAAMLHQRISNGRWLPGISDLSTVKNDVAVVRRIIREWERIMRHDFRPVLEPALESIYAIEETGKAGGLERVLRHITAEAERIAETYADMGADHAGPLFNRVMGNQASDGAFFTRPPAAALAARLTLDACGDADWSDEAVWRQHKTVDLACGSGTLLAAVLTDMKRRARASGADERRLAALQKLGVEHVIKGLDINPVSLQLAASQLTAGNQDIRYRRMGLHEMPYGPDKRDPTRSIGVGTLELLGQQAIVPQTNALGLPDAAVGSRAVWDPSDDAELEDAVDAARDARIIIMNPPFSSRAKMGEKFPAATKQRLRTRVDAMENILVGADQELDGFVDKNAMGPVFVALADRCLAPADGVLTMIHPTIALCNPSGLHERRILAQRYHIHTVLTSHQPGQSNLGQNSAINESIVVAKRHDGPKSPTRFIQLDRMPTDEAQVHDLHRCLLECETGQLDNGWGETSYWPAARMAAGDWTAAVWRSPELAEAAAKYAEHPDLRTIAAPPALSIHQTGRELSGSFERVDHSAIGCFPVLDAARSDAQTTILSTPDEWWIPKKRDESVRRGNGGTYPQADKMLQKAGYLLITAAQDSGTARLTATASDTKYVGNSWLPVTGLSAEEAKAAAVFINSTPGRLQLMRNLGRKLTFPIYRPAGVGNIRIPDVKDDRIRGILAACWERTKDMVVPQFRDGECAVRALWDEAVAAAMGWDARELARQRALLHNEPHVRGLGYNQYADEPEEAA